MATRDAQRRETRQRIYEAALAIFRRDGVAECRTDDIASAAGVSRGAFYFHFPTKEHVLLERMHETERAICAEIDALPPSAPLDRALATFNRSMAETWEPDPGLLPELVGAALRFTALTMHDQEATPLRSLLAERFRRAVEQGEVTARLPPETLGDVYLANTLGGLLAWYGNRALPLRGVLDAVTDLFWNGTKARATPSDPPAPKRDRAPVATKQPVVEKKAAKKKTAPSKRRAR